MARDFDGVTNTNLEATTHFGMGTASVTFGGWVNLDSTSEDGSFCKIGSADGIDTPADGYGVGVGLNTMDASGNDLIGLKEGLAWIDTNDALSTGWVHVMVTIDSSNDWEFFINGTSVFTSTQSAANTPTAKTQLGGYDPNGSNYRFTDCFQDEWAGWTSVLTGNQITALARGVNPFVINNNKAFHAPMTGNESPESQYVGGSNTFTVNSATKASSASPHELLENYL